MPFIKDYNNKEKTLKIKTCNLINKVFIVNKKIYVYEPI